MGCEHCQTSNDCKTLNTVLKVLAESPRFKEQTALYEAYEAYLMYLNKAQWNYPLGESPCHLAGQNQEVRRLVDQLIWLWREAHEAGKIRFGESDFEVEVMYD